MARAPSTGYYFEPLAERLALVLEGAAFPSGDGWAWVGDPLEMPAEVALLEVATRWPGVDPELLEIEYETDYARAVEEIDRLRGEEALRKRSGGELDFDVRALLAQAEELQAQAALLRAPAAKSSETFEPSSKTSENSSESSKNSSESFEKSSESSEKSSATVGEAIARAAAISLTKKR